MFAECKICKIQWTSRESFLKDSNISLVGYNAHFEKLTLGILLFNHKCKTTIGIKVEEFLDMYEGPIFENNLKNSSGCMGFCEQKDNLDSCNEPCECNFVREIILKIKNSQ